VNIKVMNFILRYRAIKFINVLFKLMLICFEANDHTDQ
jgi:hypothetical protein